jgi:chemotaxis protein methyltransferase CheR
MEKKVRLEVGEAEIDKANDMMNRSHGIDFSGYSRASLTRRIQKIADKDANGDYNSLLSRVASDHEHFLKFLKEVTVNVTEMFRDPSFFAAIRKNVLPELSNFKELRLWHAARSTGEEVYSMAILLNEARLLERSRIYGTDLNPDVIRRAQHATFSTRLIDEYSQNYALSDGRSSFKEYYSETYRNAVFKDFLRKNTTFSEHNIVTDDPFDKFNLIMCRNTLIYFQNHFNQRCSVCLKRASSLEDFFA